MLSSLIMFAIVATISPGGATTLATASGAQFGYVRSLPLILGIAAGLAVLVATSATGLTALLEIVPGLALTMKIVGSAYLLWLAVKIIRAGSPQGGRAGGGEGSTAPVGFIGGVVLLLVNPKGWAMAFGVAASFSALSDDPLLLALVLAAVFASAAFASLSLWCVAGVVLARVLRTDRHWRILNASLGALLCASILPFWL